MTQKATIYKGNRYPDSYASRHIYNKKDSFFRLYSKSYEFVTTNRNIIRSEKVSIIQLALLNKSDITLSNIAFAPKYNSNLISFG